MKLPVIFLMGPTGCGKTDLALMLCEKTPCEIISVDSALIYRGMDIGTAKPAVELRNRFPHHLINILDPHERYSAARFKQDAEDIIKKVHLRKRLPILVGGTMFYFHAFEHGLDEMPGVDEDLEERIEQLGITRGVNFLYRMLKKVDAYTAEQLHPNDTQRIKRALGISLSGGHSLRELQRGVPEPLPYSIKKFSLNYRQRSILHQRIEQRFDQMLNDGIIEETIALLLRGDLDVRMPAMRAVGYAQILSYLTGEMDFEIMRRRAIYATRQLAKRQLTWLRRMQNVCEYYVDEQSIIEISNHLHKKLTEI